MYEDTSDGSLAVGAVDGLWSFGEAERMKFIFAVFAGDHMYKFGFELYFFIIITIDEVV